MYDSTDGERIKIHSLTSVDSNNLNVMGLAMFPTEKKLYTMGVMS